MSTKHKRKNKYDLKKIKYTAEDKALILDFINGYKREDIYPPKNFHIRRNSAIKLINSLGRQADALAASAKKSFKPILVVNIKALFYKYYNTKKAYPKLTYNAEYEKKLDALTDIVAMVEAEKLAKEKASLKNPDCADLRPFLNHPGAYSHFFNSD
ncbi:MAG: hypothetical protein IJL89_03795, partial [Firmicutes bacterium]|nr:hypothetical protein [Bacillota bacterium]